MIKFISEGEFLVKIENEIEKLILPLIIEENDLLEMKIVRNVFSRKDGKKIDRVETFAKIRVKKVSVEKMRIIGRIEEVSNERVDRGFHGENIEIGKEMKIYKEKHSPEIENFVKKIEKIKVEKNLELETLLSENQKKIVTETEKLREYLKYGLIEKLFVCKSFFYSFLEEIKIALEKNSEVLLAENRSFCDKIRILGILRFEV